jgi:hypothetical protein
LRCPYKGLAPVNVCVSTKNAWKVCRWKPRRPPPKWAFGGRPGLSSSRAQCERRPSPGPRVRPSQIQAAPPIRPAVPSEPVERVVPRPPNDRRFVTPSRRCPSPAPGPNRPWTSPPRCSLASATTAPSRPPGANPYGSRSGTPGVYAPRPSRRRGLRRRARRSARATPRPKRTQRLPCRRYHRQSRR